LGRIQHAPRSKAIAKVHVFFYKSKVDFKKYKWLILLELFSFLYAQISSQFQPKSIQMKDLTLEACVESFSEAQSAQRKGAQQIELCDRLDLGGITPTHHLIRRAKEQLTLNIKVMIRPRGGDFLYTAAELDQMKADIRFCKAMHVYGVVFGVLTPKKTLDIPRIKTLADLAAPMQVTIHRAIDETIDILAAVRELSLLDNVHCILSSGQAATARDGADTLRKMIEIAGDRLTIIPAGKVTSQNIAELHNLVDSTIYHGTRIVGLL